jgi:hypothetical protein
VAPRDNEPSLFDDQEEPDLTPPEGDFELYWHKDADKMRTKVWHGYYRARSTEGGDYEIRSVPSSLSEYSVPGGLMPTTNDDGRTGEMRLYIAWSSTRSHWPP